MPADTRAAGANGVRRDRTELLFAGDDTSAVDAFHARTTWGRTLDRGLSSRIRAFLSEPALREIVSRSRNEHRDAESIALPEAQLGELTLQQALLRRRSLASDAAPRDGAVGVDDLAAILKYSYGVLGERRLGETVPVQRLRACPSAGALYPLEIYPVVMDVTGLAPGVYHYDAVAHALSCLRREDARAAMPGFDLQPEFKAQASVVFVVTAVLLRSMAKYLDRGYRFVMNEAGALSQNLHLTAMARGLPGCVWGGFCDGDVAAYVGADGAREIVVLGFVVGKRSSHGKATS
ncbi:SagB family peptide dehydrogenase [Lysobacter silvisoli]|nr:SagB family peptide dehydrogenase [Lysobacter silvisoli]